MPTPIYNVTSCLPSPLPAKIRQDGYNIWGVLSGSVYVFQTTAVSGSTKVNVLPCLSSVPVDTAINIQIGDHVYTGNDFFLDSTDSKWKCGRPNDR